jgi:hypothetical protein
MFEPSRKRRPGLVQSRRNRVRRDPKQSRDLSVSEVSEIAEEDDLPLPQR